MGISVIAITAVATAVARAQAVDTLDPITVVATKQEEKAIDALAPVSTVRREQIYQILPKRLSDLLIAVPGVTVQERGDDPATAVNIRGLQDFGRVAVVVDGARQNYQRSGHGANGAFFLDPELIGGIDVVRGPTANIYGSGAIGGVVAFRTKDFQDVVRPGERWGAEAHTQAGTNNGSGLASTFGGVRIGDNAELFAGGSFKRQTNYDDGHGNEVQNSWNQTGSALAKATLRPADGHEVKLSGIVQNFQYDFGQPTRALGTGTSVYATDLTNTTTAARWRYTRPDDRLLDWDANVYWNRTESNQVKTAHTSKSSLAPCPPGVPGNAISGCLGDQRDYRLDTIGFDANNTSRFDALGLRHAVTIGGDAFTDKVETFDQRGNSDITTPGGERTVGGAFAQLKSNHGTWLEVIGAARYDAYRLEGLGTTTSGDRVSPKITVGVTPIRGVTPYATYAEGYRAPSLTETVVTGAHAGPGIPPFLLFRCPDGQLGMFCFLPNPGLRPEIGKTKEVGVNLTFDDVLMPGATFRGKVNVFRNDVDDYIELTAVGARRIDYNYYQYQNIAHARIEGVEVETLYDTGAWFLGLAGQLQRGENVDTGVGLVRVQPSKIVTTVGTRFLDRKITAMVRWAAVGANDDLPPNYQPADSYNLVNVYVGYQPTSDVLMSFGIDNLLNAYYRPYPIPRSADAGGQNDALWASPAPGITFKGSVKIRFGA